MKKNLFKRIVSVCSAAVMMCSIGITADLPEVKAYAADIVDFSLSDLTMTDAYCTNAFEKEMDYLLAFDTERLLAGFRDNAGLSTNGAKRYGGWENTNIAGHSVGHYLTAIAQAYQNPNTTAEQREALYNRMKTLIDGMKICQQNSRGKKGFLWAAPVPSDGNVERQFDRVEIGKANIFDDAWVPWYTMHKLIAGLVDVYKATGYAPAKEVGSLLGDWVYNRASGWNEQTHRTVLSIEYGGMNDCMYDLYAITGKDSHAAAAHYFDEDALFQKVMQGGRDVLNNRHANTTIPKFIGALKRYTVLDGKVVNGQKVDASAYLKYAETFWEMVTTHHTYITGGNSEWEHFGKDDILNAERTNCNCETCNTYNMLKLSRELFKITGEKKYSDYYENTFINAILSSQNPDTGMTTYFQPMATGFFKVYSSPDEHFWCCTGSGMENFSKLGDSIYFCNNNSIIINRYTSSQIFLDEKNLTITQIAELPTVTLTVNGSAVAEIVLRVPDWCEQDPTIIINGNKEPICIREGFIRLNRLWNDGDIIKYEMNMKITAHPLPDNENSVAFKYGPWVLSADLGCRDMNTDTTGVNVTVPLWDAETDEVIVLKKGTVKELLCNPGEYFVKSENSVEFTLTGTNRNLIFSPLYKHHKNRYGIYFTLADSNTKLPEKKTDKYILIDAVPIGNDQYEFSHNLRSENSSSGNFKGLMFRDAAANGWFSYDLAVTDSAENYLQVKYYSGDAGRSFKIYAENEILADVTLENPNPNGFYDMYYRLPQKLTEGKTKITVRFTAGNNSCAGGIFDKITIVKEK